MRSGSLFCTILMHAIFNTISCLMMYYEIKDSTLEANIYYLIPYAILSMGLFFLIKEKPGVAETAAITD